LDTLFAICFPSFIFALRSVRSSHLLLSFLFRNYTPHSYIISPIY
jgi:hypothetical protein